MMIDSVYSGGNLWKKDATLGMNERREPVKSPDHPPSHSLRIRCLYSVMFVIKLKDGEWF